MLRLRIVPREKLRVIYNGIDVEKFKKSDARAAREHLGITGRPTLVSVGSLTKQKGYPYLLEAAAKLKEPYPHFIWLVLGEGSERKVLEEKATALGLRDDVRFLGMKDNVIDYLRAADIFVLASLWEGLPNVVLEAMACELPVVATEVGGVRELIEDGVNGFLVPPKDAGALAQKIRYVIELPEAERQRVGSAARKRIVERFSVGTMVREYERLYNELLG
jgi:glycosyltransferase involved in cell wall biosynthesis